MGLLTYDISVQCSESQCECVCRPPEVKTEARPGLAGGADLSWVGLMRAEKPEPHGHRFLSPTLCVKWP